MKIISIILLAISFLILFLTIRFVFIEFLLKIFNVSKRIENLLFVSLSVIIIVAFFFVITKSNEIAKNEKLNIYNDSINIINKRNFIDSVKYKTITDRVEQFIKYSNLHIIDSVLIFYEDTVDRCFLLMNVPKSTIETQIKLYWRTYPNDKFLYKKSNIDTTFFNFDSCYVSVFGVNSKFSNKPVNLRTDMKFNNKMNIYYIRSFYDVDIQTEIQLQTEQSKAKAKY